MAELITNEAAARTGAHLAAARTRRRVTRIAVDELRNEAGPRPQPVALVRFYLAQKLRAGTMFDAGDPEYTTAVRFGRWEVVHRPPPAPPRNDLEFFLTMRKGPYAPVLVERAFEHMWYGFGMGERAADGVSTILLNAIGEELPALARTTSE